MQGVLDALVKRVLRCAHAVGCVYMSLDSTSPEVLFGGTWERIAQGRMLLGMGAIEENHNSYWGTVSPGEVNPGYAGEMGGEAWHKLTENEMPSHSHGSISANGDENFKILYGVGGNITTSAGTINYTSGSGSFELKTVTAGGGVSHNNMPPYLAVYMWRRTA